MLTYQLIPYKPKPSPVQPLTSLLPAGLTRVCGRRRGSSKLCTRSFFSGKPITSTCQPVECQPELRTSYVSSFPGHVPGNEASCIHDSHGCKPSHMHVIRPAESISNSRLQLNSSNLDASKDTQQFLQEQRFRG